MILCSKLKNGWCKIVTISKVVTKFNVTKSRLNCIYSLGKKCISNGLLAPIQQIKRHEIEIETLNFYDMVWR